MYFVLGLLVPIGFKKNCIIKFLVVLFIPLITEFLQDFIEMRRSDPVDMYYDYFGLSVGIITVLVAKNVKKN